MKRAPARFEVKYLITQDLMTPFLGHLRARMNPDPHGSRGPGVYKIFSIYFDTPDLEMYHDKMSGISPRKKFRIRYYDGPNTPYKMEVKERINDQIIKTPYKMSKANLREAMLGLPMTNADSSNYVVFQYNRYVRERCMRPILHNTYIRTAFMNNMPGELRVTFDTEIRVRRYYGDGYHPTPEYAISHPQWITLEIKFNEIMPTWINDMVRRFSLQNTAVCKYTSGINRLLKLGLIPVADPFDGDGRPLCASSLSMDRQFTDMNFNLPPVLPGITQGTIVK